MEYFKAVVLAVVEGITEFLPVSSTGHLILLENYLVLAGSRDFAESFMVIIQFPAIAAVVLYFWRDLWPFGKDGNGGIKPEPSVVVVRTPHLSISLSEKAAKTLRLWVVVAVGFIPAAVLGFLLHDLIRAWLFNPYTVCVALFIGGIFLILLERLRHSVTASSIHDISYTTAFFIGCFQCLAMIPGTSRSASTIIGGMLLGASRPVAAEFSFFLAVPTMLGATTLTLLKSGVNFTGEEWVLLIIGSVISFGVAYLSIAFLMRFIQRHSFAAFGVYRIILSIIVMTLLLTGWAGVAGSIVD